MIPPALRVRRYENVTLVLVAVLLYNNFKCPTTLVPLASFAPSCTSQRLRYIMSAGLPQSNFNSAILEIQDSIYLSVLFCI